MQDTGNKGEEVAGVPRKSVALLGVHVCVFSYVITDDSRSFRSIAEFIQARLEDDSRGGISSEKRFNAMRHPERLGFPK